jgi:hypothetical protein
MTITTAHVSPQDIVISEAYPNIGDSTLQKLKKLCDWNDLDIAKRPYQVIKEGGKEKIFLSAAGYQMLAHNTGELAGIDETVFGPNQVFIFSGKDYSVPETARVSVYRKKPGDTTAARFTYTVFFSEYGTEVSHAKYPHMFMSKWATAMALRLAFTDVIGSIASAEEVQVGMDFSRQKLGNVNLVSSNLVSNNSPLSSLQLDDDAVIAEVLAEETTAVVNQELTQMLETAGNGRKHQDTLLKEIFGG